MYLIYMYFVVNKDKNAKPGYTFCVNQNKENLENLETQITD